MSVAVIDIPRNVCLWSTQHNMHFSPRLKQKTTALGGYPPHQNLLTGPVAE